MDKATKTKFFMLVAIGLVIVSVAAFNIFNKEEGKEDSDFEDGFGQVNYEEETNKNELDVSDPIKTETDFSQDDQNYDKEYTDQFGADSLKLAKETARKATTMWLQDEDDLSAWEGISDPSFFMSIKEELATGSDGITRNIKELELFSVASDESDEVKIEVIATWDIMNGQTVVKEQTQAIYVTLIQSPEENKWIVKGIV